MPNTITAVGFGDESDPSEPALTYTAGSGTNVNVTFAPDLDQSAKRTQRKDTKADVRSIRNRIFGSKLPVKTYHVSQWGIDVGVRAMSAGERVEWVQSRQDAPDDDARGAPAPAGGGGDGLGTQLGGRRGRRHQPTKTSTHSVAARVTAVIAITIVRTKPFVNVPA